MSGSASSGEWRERGGGSARSRWSVVALLMTLCFISHLNRISMSVAGDARIMKQYDITPEEMGWVYSSFLIVYTVVMIPGGILIDRYGWRVALVVVGCGSAVFCWGTGLAGYLFSSSSILLALAVVRGTMGFFSAPLHPGCARAVGDALPGPQHRVVNGLVTGAALVGIACSHTLFGAMIERFDWPKAFVIMGMVTAVWTLIWMRVTRGYRARTLPASAPLWGRNGVLLRAVRLLARREILLLTLSYAAVGYFQYLFFYWMHYYFEDVLKLGTEKSAYYSAIPPLAMAVGMPLGGWLADRWQRAPGQLPGSSIVPMVGMILGAAFLACGVISRSPESIVVWFSLALAAVGAAEGAFWASAVEEGSEAGGTTAAVVNTGGNAGGLLAPIITPLASLYWGWPTGIALGGVVCLLGAFCWLGIRRGSLRSG